MRVSENVNGSNVKTVASVISVVVCVRGICSALLNRNTNKYLVRGECVTDYRSLGINRSLAAFAGIVGSAGIVAAFGRGEGVERASHELVLSAVILHLKRGYGDGCADNESIVGELVAVNGLIFKAGYYDGRILVVIKLGDRTGELEAAVYAFIVSKTVKLVKDRSSIGFGGGLFGGRHSLSVCLGNECDGELRNTGVFSGDVSTLGNTDRAVGAVSTDNVFDVVDLYEPSLNLCLVVVYTVGGVGIGDELAGLFGCFVSGGIRVNILLCAADSGVELVAALYLFGIEVKTRLRIGRGYDELARLGFAGCEYGLTESCLNEIDLVGFIFLQIVHRSGRIVYGKHAGEFLGCARAVSSRNGCGQRVGNLGFILGRNLNGVKSVFKNEGNGVKARSPSDREGGSAFKNNLSRQLVISRRRLAVIGLVHAVQIGNSILKSGRCRGSRRGFVGAAAGSKHAKTHDRRKEKNE